jgi:hypothetical protein
MAERGVIHEGKIQEIAARRHRTDYQMTTSAVCASIRTITAIRCGPQPRYGLQYHPSRDFDSGQRDQGVDRDIDYADYASDQELKRHRSRRLGCCILAGLPQVCLIQVKVFGPLDPKLTRPATREDFR